MFLVVEDCEVYPVNWWNRHSHWSRASKRPQQKSSQLDFGLRLRLMTDKIRQRFISKVIAFLDAALSVPGCIGGRRQHLHHAIPVYDIIITASRPMMRWCSLIMNSLWCNAILQWVYYYSFSPRRDVSWRNLSIFPFLVTQKSRRSQHRRVSATLINWVKTLWRKRLRFSSFKAPTLTACQCESEIMELHRTWVNQA